MNLSYTSFVSNTSIRQDADTCKRIRSYTCLLTISCTRLWLHLTQVFDWWNEWESENVVCSSFASYPCLYSCLCQNCLYHENSIVVASWMSTCSCCWASGRRHKDIIHREDSCLWISMSNMCQSAMREEDIGYSDYDLSPYDENEYVASSKSRGSDSSCARDQAPNVCSNEDRLA